MLSGFRLRRLIAITEKIKMMIAATIMTATSTRYNGVGDGSVILSVLETMETSSLSVLELSSLSVLESSVGVGDGGSRCRCW